MNFEDMTDYELCCLYADYHEWLVAPHAPKDELVRAKYTGMMHGIMLEIGRRWGCLYEQTEQITN